MILKPTKSIQKLQNATVENPKVGQRYHLSWAKKRGMVWVLKEIDGETCLMETLKTKKQLTTHISTLRLTNKSILKII
jgi:hypothetical protein